MFRISSSKSQPVLLLATIVVVVVGAFGQSSTERPRYFCGKGEVISIDEDKTSVTIKHQRIEGFMEAMTMRFKTADASVTDGIRPGDHIRFTLKDTADTTRLIYIEKLLRER